MIDWGSRPISASGKLESIASASQKGTLNSDAEKLNATEENSLLLEPHRYLAAEEPCDGGLSGEPWPVQAVFLWQILTQKN